MSTMLDVALLEKYWREGPDGWEPLEASGLPAFRRCAGKGAPRLYLSAGIHGDEPAGPLACAEWMRDAGFWQDWEVYLFPLLNPRGMRLGTRDSPEGVDLNRDYFLARTPEIAAHRQALARLPRMDVAVCLHEDWEARGVYLYYLHPDQETDRARRVLESMGGIIPIEQAAEIDGRAAERGLIHRRAVDFEGELWPEAVYLGQHLAGPVFTLETPSSHPLPDRVRAHRAGVSEILRVFHPGRMA
ncbi:MAG: M14 family metallocarboxypeptidase [Candidatus Methylacidiphilales bacterium]|nr:M14 family metallocarboxypeptidase [Candidatus Methylacidiphilales bacterium]